MSFSFAIQHNKAIFFLCLALCLAGAYAALGMPSSIFPQTNFPRVVILIDNGVMPANEMMATITRPVEEAVKDIPGVVTVRSKTGRGTAEVNVFFTWQADMAQAELFVQGRLGVVQKSLPATAGTAVWRLTFAAFPVVGLSLTGSNYALTELWETARYQLQPQLLRIPGVARVGIVGGRAPEYHVIVDPLRLQAVHLSLAQVTDALNKNNQVTPAGMLEENYKLYLTLVDGRVHSLTDIENMTVTAVTAPPNATVIPAAIGHPVRIKDFAHVERAPEPVFNIVTAKGEKAVLLNVYSQPDGSTLDIAQQLKEELALLLKTLPPDMHADVFYDQSLLVGDSIQSVWEAIVLGLILSVVILYLFLKNWGATLIAATVIPATVLMTLLAMRVLGLSFNLMTLGGIAAAIGLIIDDAIVVVEAIHTKINHGNPRRTAVQQALSEIFRPLLASTLTPVVVFIPLAFLDGVAGNFFRALSLTMGVSLLTSLVLAVTLIPALAASWLPVSRHDPIQSEQVNWLERLTNFYEETMRSALQRTGRILLGCGVVLALGISLYARLESEFLPFMDEGAFVLDYHTPWGTNLTETDRQLTQAEKLLHELPELDSYSRRTGAQLGLGISQTHGGDFLVKLKANRSRKTDVIIAGLRQQLLEQAPGVEWEFASILNDLIGDLTWSPRPIEIKLFSTDVEWLKHKAPQIEAELSKIAGVVDTFDGLETTGPSLRLQVRSLDAGRFGLTTNDVAIAVSTAMLGQKASYVLEGDRVVTIRVRMATDASNQIADLRELPLRSPDGRTVKLSQVADVVTEAGQLQLNREDLRQLVAVSARLENRDLGSAIAEIKAKLSNDPSLPSGVLEFGGLYKEQQQSFHNLMRVLLASVFLVFTVLLIEFGSFYEAIAIVFGSLLALCGTVLAWYLTGTSVNIVSLLGAIIGIGVVAKNGILMLDSVHQLESSGKNLVDALAESGRRRLRPVLMTSLAATLGLLPLAYGIGAGSDMLKPLAIAVIGALTLSVLLSLIATPVVYYMMRKGLSKARHFQ